MDLNLKLGIMTNIACNSSAGPFLSSLTFETHFFYLFLVLAFETQFLFFRD